MVRELLDGLPINYVIVRMDGSEIASESAREDRFYNKKKKRKKTRNYGRVEDLAPLCRQFGYGLIQFFQD